jgi:hypothetical protein
MLKLFNCNSRDEIEEHDFKKHFKTNIPTIQEISDWNPYTQTITIDELNGHKIANIIRHDHASPFRMAREIKALIEKENCVSVTVVTIHSSLGMDKQTILFRHIRPSNIDTFLSHSKYIYNIDPAVTENGGLVIHEKSKLTRAPHPGEVEFDIHTSWSFHKHRIQYNTLLPELLRWPGRINFGYDKNHPLAEVEPFTHLKKVIDEQIEETLQGRRPQRYFYTTKNFNIYQIYTLPWDVEQETMVLGHIQIIAEKPSN